MVSENALPLATAVVFAGSNQDFAAPARSVVNIRVPVSWVPVAALNTRVALLKSRGVELASKSTWNPEDVTLTIFTEPGTIAGGNCGIVTVAAAGGTGLGKDWPVAAIASEINCSVIVPAMLPNWMAGSTTGTVELAGIVTGGDLTLPLTNRIAGFVEFAGKPAAFGANESWKMAVKSCG